MRRWLHADLRLSRGRRWYVDVTDRVARVLSVAVYAAAAVCPVIMLVYAGYDSDAVDRRLLLRLLGVVQGVFLTDIIFNLVFRFRRMLEESRAVRRVAEAILLLTLIPVLFHHSGGTCGEVLHFFQSRGFLFAGLGIYSVAELCYGAMQLPGRRTNPSLLLSGSFLFFIVIGSLVLMLPRCTTEHISYIDALFMAASAVSMTGLCTVDAAATFTPMGWLVIAVLMQVGALGVLTFTSFFALFFSGRGSIYNQLLIRDFIYSKSMSRLLPVLLYILGFTLTIEAAGAVAVYVTLPDGFLGSDGERMAFAAFHSLSAFCNAGFTTLPDGLADPALLGHSNSFYLVMSVLILAGGIGFPNLVNFKEAAGEYLRRLRAKVLRRKYMRRVHVYDLNTKLVLVFTAILFAGGAAMFYLLEYNNTMEGLGATDRAVRALFSSATVRTAGFAISQPEAWLGSTLTLAMMLMWIGCASQSMGGGIKINAFAAVLLNLRSIVRGQRGITVFKRTVAPASVRRANAVVCFSIFAIAGYGVALMIFQPELPAGAVMFEAFSAVTTVGMSMGITPELSDISKVAVATAMFVGRVGIISVLCGLMGSRPDISASLPEDDIIIN